MHLKKADFAFENPGKKPHAIGIRLASRNGDPRMFRHLILDYSGTLSLDGRLLPGIAARLRELSNCLRITVLTADTFGKADRAVRGLPVEIRIIKVGREKADFIKKNNPAQIIAVGNGRNDRPMMSIAGLRIAVIGPEGAAGVLLGSADIVVTNIHHALDLLIHPLRLKANLRS